MKSKQQPQPAHEFEDWCRIPDWPGYWASTDGKIYSDRRQRVLSPWWSTNGYWRIDLRRDGRTYKFHVAELILKTFLFARPSPRHQAAHRNGVRWDNRLCNLCWALPRENAAHQQLPGYIGKRLRWQPAFIHWPHQVTA